jgi:5-methylcytosine-specific restriction protein A
VALTQIPRTERAVRQLELLAARTALREARIARRISELRLLAAWTALMGQWSAFYNTARWQRLRKHQLREHPVCAFCLQRGQVVPAVVVDHIEPHKGDWNRFCLGKLQSLCEVCHNGRKREIELRGYCTDVGLDGYPLDPNHPFNRAR